MSITQGNYEIVKFWDGLGRSEGYREEGDGIKIYYYKDLDAEGRVIAENKGSVNSSDKYRYILNAYGKVKKITDPRGKKTIISLSADSKSIKDPKGHITNVYYDDLPSLPTKVNGPIGTNTYYSYDSIGRLTKINQNGSRIHTFSYDGLDHITYESHPETGGISYSYDSAGNLSSKKWGGINIYYSYNSSNQLVKEETPSEDIYYYHDSNGRIKKISSNKGWSRDNIKYNTFGSITKESQYIPGLGTKTLYYTYDSNNNLKTIIYPDGKTLNISNNSLNMPETLSFAGKTLVNSISYSVNKNLSSINISGNGTKMNFSYDGIGRLLNSSLKRGSTNLFKATYKYDSVGNLTSISNTIPTLNATFGYDKLDRLTSASYPGLKNYSFSYDSYGNLKKSYLNGVLTHNYNYTTKNQINSSSFSYDSRGNLTKNRDFNYSWTDGNNLKEIKNKNGSTVAKFLYNERGLRLRAKRLPPPEITITSPHLEDKWKQGNTYTIVWTKTGNMNSYVKIRLYQGSTKILGITDKTENDGSYQWTVPSSVTNGQYTIRVKTIDNKVYDDSDTFTISNASITITNPHSGDKWVKGNSYTIKWTKAGNMNSYVKIRLYQGSTKILGITDKTENDGSYQWTVPSSVTNGQYIIRVKTIDNKVYDDSDVFTISNSASSPLTLLSPNGNEKLSPLSLFPVKWISDQTVERVRIEFSYDNGSVFFPVKTLSSDTGVYNWDIPPVISKKCLVRISDADKKLSSPVIIYNIKFIVGKTENSSVDRIFSINLNNEKIPDSLEFISDSSSENIYLKFNNELIPLTSQDEFFNKPHELMIIENRKTYEYELYYENNKKGVINIRNIRKKKTAEISFENYSHSLNIRDFTLRIIPEEKYYPLKDNKAKDIIVKSNIVYHEDFRYKSAKEFIEKSHWKTEILNKFSNNKTIEKDMKLLSRKSYFTELLSIDNENLILKSNPENIIRISKIISIPEYYPFDISDNSFEITYNKNMEDKTTVESIEYKDNDKTTKEEDFNFNLFPQSPGATPMMRLNYNYTKQATHKNKITNSQRLYDSNFETTYYIYSYDGKLLSEYDGNGNCIRDYIYIGHRLIAEYRPQEEKYYYYMQDNTNSVRMITDDNGTVIYSAAYGPYGDNLKTWTSTYDPALKYSSKQREGWSDIDYFGARYYDNATFRFTSPDPITLNKERTYKPWLLNLYAYTRNNPMSFVDSDGRIEGMSFGHTREQYDKINPSEFREAMSIPLIVAGGVVVGGTGAWIGWTYGPAAISVIKALLLRARVFYDTQLDEILGKPVIEILRLFRYKKINAVPQEKIGFFMKKFGEGFGIGFSMPGPSVLKNYVEIPAYALGSKAQEKVLNN